MEQTSLWGILREAYSDIEPLFLKPTEFTEYLPLMGEGGVLDSIATVAFSTAIEELVAEKYDLEIRIVSEEAFSRKKSPFLTMQTLATFIGELLEAEAAKGK